MRVGETNKTMSFNELLTPETILTDWHPEDKWQAISELVICLKKAGRISLSAESQVREAVLERERKMSTGMEHGIAVPHASCNAVDGMTAAMGIIREGLDFESLDGQPTHIVVLLVYPNRELQAHIRTLAVIARLLSKAEIREQLLQSESPMNALEILRKGENE